MELDYINKIKMIKRKFDIDLYFKYYTETSSKIKITMTTKNKIQQILKLEDEFQNVLGQKTTLQSSNGFINVIIPKRNPSNYPLEKMLNSTFFINADADLKIALGEDLDGAMVLGDLTKWVNLLVAGEPGGGKSVFLHNCIHSLTSYLLPSQLQLTLFDLKKVEFTQYKNISYLNMPIITNIDDVRPSLNRIISEMNRRYEVLQNTGCRNIQTYHKKGNKMPYLVVIIDELANIILADKSIEKQIVNIAQMGRACGIHLILSTQKPSADVVTSLIKANVPTRIAFSVASHYDSMTILDESGAQNLNKRGDMYVKDEDGMERIQCAFMSDDEIEEKIHEMEDVTIIPNTEIQNDYINIEDSIEVEFEEVIEDETSELERLYKEAVEFIYNENRCSEWALKQELHIGNRKVDMIIKKLIKDNHIAPYKEGKDYKILGGEENV